MEVQPHVVCICTRFQHMMFRDGVIAEGLEEEVLDGYPYLWSDTNLDKMQQCIFNYVKGAGGGSIVSNIRNS